MSDGKCDRETSTSKKLRKLLLSIYLEDLKTADKPILTYEFNYIQELQVNPEFLARTGTFPGQGHAHC